MLFLVVMMACLGFCAMAWKIYSTPDPADGEQGDFDIAMMVILERSRQDERHGWPRDLDEGVDEYLAFGEALAAFAGKGLEEGEQSFADLLLEETGEAISEPDPDLRVLELVQVAAVAQMWVKHILNSREPQADDPEYFVRPMHEEDAVIGFEVFHGETGRVVERHPAHRRTAGWMIEARVAAESAAEDLNKGRPRRF